MAFLTYKDLQDRVLRQLDEAGDTGTTLAIAKDNIQSAHDQRVTSEPWRFMLWPERVTLPTVAGQESYSLHQEFHRPLYFFNRNTETYLIEVPHRQLESTGVRWLTDTGSADRFYLEGVQPVIAQPPTAQQISIVSSSAGDTSSKTVIVRGMTANGMVTETLSANGVTPVTSTNSFSAILNVTKPATWGGTMTMSCATPSTTLLTLFAAELGRQYNKLFLLRAPTAVETIEYRFFRRPSPLSLDNDIPDIPAPFAEITVYDALILMAGYNTELNPQAVQVWRERRDALEEGMEQAFLEGQSISSEVRYVRYMGDDSVFPVPRINS